MWSMESKPILWVASLLLAASLILAACGPLVSVQEVVPATGPTAGAAPTAEMAPEPRPSPTAEPSPASSPALEPTPLPQAQSPTVAERLELAIAQQTNGEYEVAGAGFRALLESNPDAEIEREALLRLARCELLAGAYGAAAQSLDHFIASYSQDPDIANAYFWLGQALAAQGEGQAATDAYRRYLERNPLLVSYVQERIGEALAGAGDHAAAIVAYRAAADSEPAVSNKARILESLAASQRALKRYDEAVGTYDEILGFAKNAGYRAEIMFEAGATLREAGQETAAAARWNELVATYPATAYAAQALEWLDEWGLAQVDLLTRARVTYGAGRYTEALSALQRYIQAEPQSHSGDAHYYAALCYRSLGRHWDSVREFDWLINTHPQNALVPESWYEKGESLALLGAVDEAAATLLRLAGYYPQHPRGVQALWRAAQVYDEAGRSWDASAAYARAAATYPGAAYASDARFRAGLTHYLSQAPLTAIETWTELLPQETNPAMRARLFLWLGKAALQLNDTAGARERWIQATNADPTGFWGLRARDLLDGRRFTGQAPAGAFDATRYLPRGDQAEAEAWLASWAGARPDGQPATALPVAVTGLESYRRGLALWTLGDSAAMIDELRQVQAAVKDDPWALYALTLHYRDLGIYLFSTSAAEQVLALAPVEARRNSPRFLEELAYPTYYADLVLEEARASNVDPLLFFALVRQESRFDAQATSHADARGLTQVIPSTGQYIAGKLGDSSFTPERLWRPVVSVHYGMWYFANALRMFDDNGLVALVAYNAGPGNASKWRQLAGGDDDLFYERVTSSEPRAYLRRIYEHRVHYERLYR